MIKYLEIRHWVWLKWRNYKAKMVRALTGSFNSLRKFTNTKLLPLLVKVHLVACIRLSIWLTVNNTPLKCTSNHSSQNIWPDRHIERLKFWENCLISKIMSSHLKWKILFCQRSHLSQPIKKEKKWNKMSSKLTQEARSMTCWWTVTRLILCVLWWS